MSHKPKVIEALRMVDAGATPYKASQETGVAQSTIGRALKRRAAVCQTCGGTRRNAVAAHDRPSVVMENDDEDLKPCPCCGSGAHFDMVESDSLIDGRAGGWFVECNNSECRLTTQLMFATGDDPRLRLREIWNKRHNA